MFEQGLGESSEISVHVDRGVDPVVLEQCRADHVGHCRHQYRLDAWLKSFEVLQNSRPVIQPQLVGVDKHHHAKADVRRIPRFSQLQSDLGFSKDLYVWPTCSETPSEV